MRAAPKKINFLFFNFGWNFGWDVGLGVGLIFFILNPTPAAAIFELSGSASYNMSYYGADNYTWSRHWEASFGYYVGSQSEIEISFQDITNRDNLAGLQNTTFHDQIYSLSWLQTLVPKSFFFQPYIKLGVGQLNREASGTYATGLSPPLIYDSFTEILGVGAKMVIYGPTALRVEGTTYISDGDVSTWQNNFSINTGISIYF